MEMPKLPVNSSTTTVRKTDYPAFANDIKSDILERSLERLSVRSVRAIWHRCLPHWGGSMKNRRIADDMFFYVTKGRGQIEVEGRKNSLRPGICASFRRGVIHSAATNPKDPIEVICLHYTASVFEALTLPALLDFPDFFDIGNDKELHGMFQEACREYTLQPSGFKRSLESIATRILIHLIRTYPSLINFQKHVGKMEDLKRLLPSLELMDKNLSQPLPISKLAITVGYSEVQFRRVFVRMMGVTPVQHLRQIRMEAACRLLRATSQTLESISYEVGYQEPSFFAHSFKKIMGIAPGEYRRNQEL